MGNQLVSSVRTVIRPIDYYLSEVPEYKFKCSLGQTQFLKVALCASHEGDVVIKVLSHEDPSLLLEQYKQELLELAKITRNNLSIASFRMVEIRPNFAFMARQYVRFSLYDRISTRPFLSDIEKAWIVYQLFRCMAWCHDRKIYHGDIKLENILITSNLWVVLSDFASYKPVRLPQDNPLFFNYFFDTSRRRCCNIAPERFVLSSMDNAGLLSSQQNVFTSFFQDGHLNPKMDMFSLGCILAEIFSDNYLFDLSQLLLYKENKYDRVWQVIDTIQNETIRAVVKNLISLEPTERKSCKQILTELKTVYFPSYFDELYELMVTLWRLPPDAKILYLIQEIGFFHSNIINENPKGTLILLMTLTSSLRSLKHVFCKIEAQRMIYRLVATTPCMASYVTDRLIPYLVHCMFDSDPRVRGEAVNNITQLLACVIRLPSSDHNIFTDYLMEIFQKFVIAEKSIYVRICLAKNMGRLSRIALSFLNQYYDQNYDEELKLLHKYFHNLVATLITDPNNCVRRFLLLTPGNCSQLCTFFGRDKTNEVILSHIITFLNDKHDFKLRLSFFDNIVVIASYLGIQCSTILYPLLQQGLCDAEEVIIAKTITSIASLVEQGLFAKQIIVEMLREIVPLIYHPNLWINNAVMSFISILSTFLNEIDLNIKVLPVIKPYYTRNTRYFSDLFMCRELFSKSMPRPVFDTVLQCKDADVLASMLELLREHYITSNADYLRGKSTNALYKRLMAENINLNTEKQLIALKDLLIRIHRNKRNAASLKQDEWTNLIDYQNYDIKTREVSLVNHANLKINVASNNANQEWLHMFGLNLVQSESSSSSVVALPPRPSSDLDYTYFECPPHSREVRCLLQHKKKSFTHFPSVTVTQTPPFRPRGNLVTHLYEHKSCVNQMARYGNTNYFVTCSDDGSIRLWDLCDEPGRYVIHRSKFQFRMEFSNGTPLCFKGMVNCGKYIVAFSNDCLVQIFELVEASLQLTCTFKVGSPRHVAPLFITSICALNDYLFAVSLTDSVVYIYDTRYLYTHFFNVPVSKLALPPSQRTIMSIDGSPQVLCAATACGYMTAFDLRFHLKINAFTSKLDNVNSKLSGRVSRIKFTTMGLFASVQGSNDICLWDIKTGQKNRILSTQKSTDVHAVVNAILPMINNTSCGLLTGGSDFRIRYWDLNEPDMSYIVSDPIYKACNYCLSKPSSSTTAQTSNKFSQTYTGQPGRYSNYFGSNYSVVPPLANYVMVQDGEIQKIQEMENSNAISYLQSSHHCALDQQLVSYAHHDAITDLLIINDYLISSGQSGTVKVWR